MSAEKKYKIYVNVSANFSIDGKILPAAITWEDGKVYEIDRILDVQRAASLKAGGCGTRYTCRIQGKERYLWLEETQWFVEGRS